MMRLVCAAIALSASARSAPAQEEARGVRDGWIVGGMLGVPGSGGEAAPRLFTLGIVATRLTPAKPGIELALGTAPQPLTDGFLTLGARAGIAFPIAMGRDGFLIPTAGVTAVGGAGTDGGGGTLGVHGGLSTVFAAGSVGLRTGITVHRIQSSPALIWLLEAGIVRVPRSAP